MMRGRLYYFGIYLFSVLLPIGLKADISALYLSWYQDPSTTMTVQWHCTNEAPENRLLWKTAAGTDWQEQKSSYHLLPNSDVQVHCVELSHLTPGTEYEFRIDSGPAVFRFRTMPQELDRPITFAVGANIFESKKLFRRTTQTMLKHDPDFIVFGGNIAHTFSLTPFSSQSSQLRHWLAFLAEWMQVAIQNNGRVIPFLIAPGDKDIQPDNYQLFFSLFAFPQEQLYRSVDFGNYLTLLLLDTGNFHPIEGPQTHWLNQTLKNSQTRPYRFAVYHESAYPSYDSYFSLAARKIRTHWCPLFDQYGLQAAFEHHHRNFKRTYPLKSHHIHETGTVYLGEGCWGAAIPQNTQNQWYLSQNSKCSGLWLVQLQANNASLSAIDRFNKIVDEFKIVNN